MTLDELKDQVFELIDREVIDPRGVDRILSRIPGGREYLQAMKAGLSLAELLPIEEPPAALDATILASLDD